MQLYEAQRHERAHGQWSESAARRALKRIVADTHRAFSPERLWPVHPFDVSPERPDALKPLYYGAAGVIWALDHLQRRGAADGVRDYTPAVCDLSLRYHDDLRANAELERYLGRDVASYLIGTTGISMLQWKLRPSLEIEQRIDAALQGKIGDARGLLWGAAGSMVAAVLMHERTGDSQWAERFVAHFDALWDGMTWDEALGCWLWVAELYGVTEARLGALHGFIANAYAMARGAHLVSPARRDAAFARISQTLRRTALVDARCANWPHNVGASDRQESMPLLVQFCSGAPGVIACLAEIDAALELDELLLAAGELVWRAGPTTKFPVLCHGAVGAGYAFLKLHARTGDDEWLARARLLAMHAVERADRALEEYGQRKYSLWTGDLGLAVFLWDCIHGSAQLPTLDVF